MKDLIKNNNNRFLSVEKLGSETCTKIFEMRQNGHTVDEVLEMVQKLGHTNISRNNLLSFFKRYDVGTKHSDSSNILRESQLRLADRNRKVDMVSNILEKQIREVNDSDMKIGERAARVGELCKLLLESVKADAQSNSIMLPGRAGVKPQGANVQVNIGDQLKKISEKKADLKKDILSIKGERVIEVEVNKDES